MTVTSSTGAERRKGRRTPCARPRTAQHTAPPASGWAGCLCPPRGRRSRSLRAADRVLAWTRGAGPAREGRTEFAEFLSPTHRLPPPMGTSGRPQGVPIPHLLTPDVASADPLPWGRWSWEVLGEETNSHVMQIFSLREWSAGDRPAGSLGPPPSCALGGLASRKSRRTNRPKGHTAVPGFSPWTREAAAVGASGPGRAEPASLSHDTRTGRSAGCGKGAGHLHHELEENHEPRRDGTHRGGREKLPLRAPCSAPGSNLCGRSRVTEHGGSTRDTGCPGSAMTREQETQTQAGSSEPGSEPGCSRAGWPPHPRRAAPQPCRRAMGQLLALVLPASWPPQPPQAHTRPGPGEAEGGLTRGLLGRLHLVRTQA